MVRLVEIEDDSQYDDDSQYTTDSDSASEKAADSDADSDYDDEDEDDDDLLDESLLERIAALKDILPVRQQQAISRAASTVGYWGSMGVRLAGKLTWVFTTSALLVVFPLALESDRDKMMQQWESGQQAAGGQPPAMAPPGGAPGMMAPAPGLA
ncbi:mitochondrial import receptor subunit Tom22 [Coemansia javaensis]|uniref:Mitochondrial import receptor subunit Tom22 n=1 Tax=Coemansia javaensis TaxID=2761396 RepID=A0A9W8HDG6_9FUNG|nr:mitochondrial import receptor subunit Tom22 [Coemansia javaensis]